jgi:hypothetical protein
MGTADGVVERVSSGAGWAGFFGDEEHAVARRSMTTRERIDKS